jgi:hypothetical protein
VTAFNTVASGELLADALTVQRERIVEKLARSPGYCATAGEVILNSTWRILLLH